MVGVGCLREGHEGIDQVVGLEPAFHQEREGLGPNAGEVPARLRQGLAAGSTGDDLNAIAVPLARQLQALSDRKSVV